MDMVRHAAYLDNKTAFVSQDSINIGKHFGTIILQQCNTIIFNVEYQMNIYLRQ